MSHRALNSEQFAGTCPECGHASNQLKPHSGGGFYTPTVACPSCTAHIDREVESDRWSAEHGGMRHPAEMARENARGRRWSPMQPGADELHPVEGAHYDDLLGTEDAYRHQGAAGEHEIRAWKEILSGAKTRK